VKWPNSSVFRMPAVPWAAMITLCAFLASNVVAVLLAGCGPSANTDPKIAENADFTITVDGKHHTCVVALYKETQGSSIPCAEAVPFLRDQLRLQGGSIYDVRIIPGMDAAQMAGLGASLKGSDYRFIGGRNDPLLAEPGKSP
jgi:hypothetical protein